MINSAKLIKGIDIQKWRLKSNRWLKNKRKLDWNQAKEFLRPKVVAQVIIAHIDNPRPHIQITACLDDEGIIITNTLMAFKLDKSINEKFWLGYLNAKFTSWYAYNFIYSRAIRTMHFYDFYIQQVPIPVSIIKDNNLQQEFIGLVDRILDIAKDDDYMQNSIKQQQVKLLERDIDQLVYKLYGLTEEEIRVVEGVSL